MKSAYQGDRSGSINCLHSPANYIPIVRLHNSLWHYYRNVQIKCVKIARTVAQFKWESGLSLDGEIFFCAAIE